MKRQSKPYMLVLSTLASVLALGSAAGCNVILGLGDFKNECDEVAQGKPCPDAGLCTAGDTVDCYTGPDGTEGKGICKAGKKTCGNNGLFGACDDEVLPRPKEICGNGADDDCNGKIDDGCPCKPGSKISCYDGSHATENTLPCHAGTQVCNANGIGYGACMGEATPKPENYDKKGDENCDGVPSADTEWAGGYSATGGMFNSASVNAIAADTSGNVFVSGGYRDTLTFGAQMITSPNQGEGQFGFVARLNADGSPRWLKSLDDSSAAGGVAVTPGGTVGVAAANFGYAAVYTFAEADGTAGWSLVCTSTDNVAAVGITSDSQGNLIVGGTGSGHSICDGMTVTNTQPGVASVWIASIDTSGHVQWVGGFGDGMQSQAFGAVTVSPDDSVWLTGTLHGSAYFGSNPQLVDAGGGDAIMVKYDSTGTPQKWKSFGDATAQAGLAIATVKKGGSYQVGVTGSNAGKVDFGNGAQTAEGITDGFVAVFDPNIGAIWDDSFGGDMAKNFGSAIGLEPGGEVMVAGYTTTKIGFGPNHQQGVFLSDDAHYGFLARIDQSGYVWSKFYGGDMGDAAASTLVNALCIEPKRHYPVIGGSYFHAANFGTGSQPDLGHGSMFIAEVAAP